MERPFYDIDTSKAKEKDSTEHSLRAKLKADGAVDSCNSNPKYQAHQRPICWDLVTLKSRVEVLHRYKGEESN